MEQDLIDDGNETSFLPAIKAGHVFFYDTELDEVVHFRKEIYEAAERSNEEIDIELTEDEEADAEDAWNILEDRKERFLDMPLIAEEMLTEWEKEFSASGQSNREDFFAEKKNAFLLEWLDSL